MTYFPETAARQALLHDLARDLTDPADRFMVASRWDDQANVVVVYSILGEDRRRPAGHPFSDAPLAWTRDNSASKGVARAAGYLLTLLTDPEDRRRASNAGQYYVNRGLATRFADGVRLAALDVKSGRGIWEHPEDRLRRENPEFARRQDQALFREAERAGII